jgi:hypothetical protein
MVATASSTALANDLRGRALEGAPGMTLLSEVSPMHLGRLAVLMPAIVQRFTKRESATPCAFGTRQRNSLSALQQQPLIRAAIRKYVSDPLRALQRGARSVSVEWCHKALSTSSKDGPRRMIQRYGRDI